MRTLRYSILLAVVLATASAHAQTTNYQVYSLFVINIAKYSSWPEQNAEMQITVFGKSKIFDELMKQNGKNVNGKTVKVTQVDNVADIGQPHIIYIADNRSGSLDDVVKATQGKPVMIIGEREGLFKKGAGFSFVIMENSTLRYDINNTELEKRQIRVSKSLTALANASI
ncbi:MAG TPA: YfiR family protein [Ohtaekwangia sp.]|uniref:YfiR family protein n=1 Tax=Ohtaekwangia sp. TaxID=2066019 RepID=UPI002F9499B6